MFGGGRSPKPPDPPPPPPNPPTYASAAAAAPVTALPRYGALSDSILTGPPGTSDPMTLANTTSRKTLLGQ
jgi:hypothetical protein